MLDIEDFKKKLDKKSRLMGIDPGKKRVGIAISDENKVIATPYRTLIKVDFETFIKDIKEIITDNNIKGIIIGKKGSDIEKLYTPNEGFTGKDKIQYTLADGEGATASATKTVYITVK